MASTYKSITSNDRIAIRTPLYESKIVTSSMLSSDGENVLNGLNGSFSSYYKKDSNNTASDLFFDITSGKSNVTDNTNLIDLDQKNSNYNQFAKVLFGTDTDGTIINFDLDFNDTPTINFPLNYAYFLDISRNLFKDEVKKGSFKLELEIEPPAHDAAATITLFDLDVGYKNDSPVGEYGALYLSGTTNDAILAAPYKISNLPNKSVPFGMIFYQAGVIVLSPFIFSKYNSSNAPVSNTTDNFNENKMGLLTGQALMTYDGAPPDRTIKQLILSSSITASAQALRNSFKNISFMSTTEVNSTVYFCRIFNNEFNYSSNPTYLKDSQIVVKTTPQDLATSFITSVGLYSEDNQLLAVAKLSEPIKKTPENELIIRTRLDF